MKKELSIHKPSTRLSKLIQKIHYTSNTVIYMIKKYLIRLGRYTIINKIEHL